ncbi:MAG: ABC transporter ATP-binding protein [Candidatus Scalinduaceae bacterium]
MLRLNHKLMFFSSFLKENLAYKVFIKKYKKYFILGTISLIMVDIINIVPPLLIKEAVDILTSDGSLTKIAYISGIYLLVSLVQGIGRYYWRINFIGTAFRCEYDLRMAFFKHIETLSQSFFQKYKTGDLLSRATNDLTAVRMAVGPGMLIGLDALFYFFIIPPIVIYLSPKLALYTFLPLPLMPYFAYKIKNTIDRRFKIVQEQFSNISEKAQENISGIRVVKGFNMSKQEENTFRKLCRDFMKKNLSLAIPQSLLGPAFEYITYLGIIILLLVGGNMVLEGTVTLGTLIAFQRYISKMVWPMTAVGWCLSLFQRGKASMKRVDEVMDLNPEIVTNKSAIKDFQPTGKIEFTDLSFRYNGNEDDVLRNVNLKIDSGQKVAIIGPVSCGKSTLVSLIPRIFSAKDNKIFLDDVDINKIDIKELRKHIGFVSQDTFLFSEKIRNNIAFGNPAISDERKVQELARLSMISKEIDDLPEGYDSYLGERGINLSGGQKQRLSIARALAINPKILIFDDCLSAVDARTEEALIKNISEVVKENTLIVVTHRIPAIKEFDFIVVMQEGVIVEKGTHQQLTKREGLYKSLYDKEVIEESLEKS